MVLLLLAPYIELDLKIKNANVCIRFSIWLTCPLEKFIWRTRSNSRIVYGITDWFQIEKGVVQSCILLLCLFILQAESTLCKMPGWMEHKLESRLPGEISITSDMQKTAPSHGKKLRRTKKHLGERERGE